MNGGGGTALRTQPGSYSFLSNGGTESLTYVMPPPPPWRGHLGREKTYATIRERFYRKGMKKDVAKYVQLCVSCSRRRPAAGKAPIQMPRFAEEPFELVSMDVVGPLPITRQGHRYLLTIVDHLTRHAEAIPIEGQLATTIAHAFVQHVVWRFGAPRRLLTDQGRNFLSEVMRQVCNLLGIQRLRTTAYHPECNGVVERFHGTLIQMIRHFVRKDGKDWDRWVPFTLMAYRNTVHSATGFTPHFLLCGREMTLPGEEWTKPVRETGERTAEDQLGLRLSEARRIACDQIKNQWALRTKGCNQRRRLKEFQPGDGVYLHHPVVPGGQAAKFHCPWTGPHGVMEKLSLVTYRLDLAGGGQTVVHINRLKPSYEGGLSSGEETDESDQDTPVTSSEEGASRSKANDLGQTELGGHIESAEEESDERGRQEEMQQRLDSPHTGTPQRNPPTSALRTLWN